MSRNQILEVTLAHDEDEIIGEVKSYGDPLFLMECMAVIVGEIAKKAGLPPLEVAADLHALIARRQKEGVM